MNTKTCQRCKNEFNCNAEDISNCSCDSIQLSEASKIYLAKTAYDCLCTPCLMAINALLAQTELHHDLSKLEETRDFYLEKGLMVFTEYYHIKKGTCCKNNCRHCAYGFQLN
jgi:hypothetical protein